jgi:hypothetical protein
MSIHRTQMPEGSPGKTPAGNHDARFGRVVAAGTRWLRRWPYTAILTVVSLFQPWLLVLTIPLGILLDYLIRSAAKFRAYMNSDAALVDAIRRERAWSPRSALVMYRCYTLASRVYMTLVMSLFAAVGAETITIASMMCLAGLAMDLLRNRFSADLAGDIGTLAAQFSHPTAES